ncbi:ATP-binding protein [Lentzea nigeriaca]|uniref:ATP-binding protein n=1 Tax=Lentzea nigeriaca TaxID=1128665 RepID=UPI00195BF5D2|nr:ATP-binding protein [Lentzea nigeriaca]MBM7864592.1 anti-sigma regulatory factor (Ser/Thr protein kinase) [Lentzea nigeriaca]
MSSGDDPDGSDPLVLDLSDHIPPLVMVRRWTAEALADLTIDELCDVLLVATELVTNAYDHGQPPCQIRLRRQYESCSVRIEVDDSSPALPVLGHSRISQTRGRGLTIVNGVSKVWGVTTRTVGKTVWADIACESSRSSADITLGVGATETARLGHHDEESDVTAQGATGSISDEGVTAPGS